MAGGFDGAEDNIADVHDALDELALPDGYVRSANRPLATGQMAPIPGRERARGGRRGAPVASAPGLGAGY